MYAKIVFLLSLGSRVLHVQVKEKKRIKGPELESLRGDVYMDGWPVRCGDRVDRMCQFYLDFVLSRVRPVFF